MSRAAILNGLRLVTAWAVILSGIPFLRAGPASHDLGHSYAMQAGADFGQASFAGRTHSHFDDHDGTALPSHGHDYTDHSHVMLGLPAPHSTSLNAPEGRLVRARDGCRVSAGPPFRLDRPPCIVSLA
jgi:hypothetical protein